MLLGHQSISITEKHYSPWTRSRQEQIEADLAAAWKLDPALAVDPAHTPAPTLVATKGTRKGHEKKSAFN